MAEIRQVTEWIYPVFDRTQADVDYAKAKLSEWKEQGHPINNALKGCLNLNDINRIENDTQYLSDNLSALYYLSHIETTSWGIRDLPDINDVNRIIGNVKKIISSNCSLDAWLCGIRTG
jgi:hypothetical protein